MKNLLQKILDGLTYRDLAGRRQPRSYTVITGLLLFTLLLVAGAALFNRTLMMRTVQETPRAVAVTAQAPSCNTYSAGLSGNASWLPHRSGKMVARSHLGQPELRSYPTGLCISGTGKDHCLGAGRTGRIQPCRSDSGTAFRRNADEAARSSDHSCPGKWYGLDSRELHPARPGFHRVASQFERRSGRNLRAARLLPDLHGRRESSRSMGRRISRDLPGGGGC